MMKLLTCLLFIATLQSLCETARILTVLPIVTQSHYATGIRLVLELVKRGHEVVCISPFEEKNPPPGFTWVPIDIKSLYEAVPNSKNKTLMKTEQFLLQKQAELWNFTTTYSEYIADLPAFNDFIQNDNSKFDLVIVEEFFIEVFYVFAHKYKAPLVLLSVFGAGHFINEFMGNPFELSYVPHEFSGLSGELNFFERAGNAFNTVFDILGRKYIHLENQNELAKRVFKGVKDIPHVGDLERNASLILINSHNSMSIVRPYLPNMIEAAGLHMNDLKPLDKDIQTLLDNSTDGAMLFSFGSIMDLSIQPDEIARDILIALGMLKQTVLIRWNSDKPLPVNSKNIYSFKWLPQNEILAHPNTIGFVTHGGIHGTLEAIHHGVPVICIPFYLDQALNCKKAESMQYGVMIKELKGDILIEAVERLLTDPKYRDTAKDLSERFRDRPLSAVNTAVYWVEYVINHKGADFLKGPKRNLYWYQYYFVDVALAVIIAIWFFMKIFVTGARMLFSRKSNNSQKKVKKN